MKKLKKVNVLAIIVFVCSIFWLMPLILIFINSFKPYNDMIQHFLSLPKSWSLDMYVETWTKFDFPLLIANTLLYTVATVVMIVLLAPMAAYKLARTKSQWYLLCTDYYADDGTVPVLYDHADTIGSKCESYWNKNGAVVGKYRTLYASGSVYDPWICKKCAY